MITLTLLDFDWDEIMMVIMGFAALGYLINDWRNNRHITDYLIELASRVSRLESNSDDSLALEVRMARIEAATELHERLDERLALVQERLGQAETHIQYLAALGQEQAEEKTEEDPE